MKYQAILFDLDGTLLNTLDDLADGVNHVLMTQGWPLRTVEEIRRFVGNGIRKLMERAVPAGTPTEELESAFLEFKAYYSSHCRIKTVPYRGIPELLAVLRNAGIPLGVVSNKNEEAVKTLILDFFPGVFSAVVGQSPQRAPKPAPDMLLYGVDLLGFRVKDCLYVGDSEVDKATADNACMDCASVTWGFCDRELLRSLSPKYLFEDPGDMLVLLDKKSFRSRNASSRYFDAGE